MYNFGIQSCVALDMTEWVWRIKQRGTGSAGGKNQQKSMYKSGPLCSSCTDTAVAAPEGVGPPLDPVLGRIDTFQDSNVPRLPHAQVLWVGLGLSKVVMSPPNPPGSQVLV